MTFRREWSPILPLLQGVRQHSVNSIVVMRVLINVVQDRIISHGFGIPILLAVFIQFDGGAMRQSPLYIYVIFHYG